MPSVERITLNIAVYIIEQFINFTLYFMVKQFKIYLFARFL